MYSEETRYTPPQRNGEARRPADLPPGEVVPGRCDRDGDVILLPEDLSDVTLGSLPIAMAYVPPQKWREILEPDIALREGTMFRELVKPFTGSRPGNENRGGCCRG